MNQKPGLRAQFTLADEIDSLIDPSDPDVPAISSFGYPKPHAADTSWTMAGNYKLANIISVTKTASEDGLRGRLDARISPGDDSVWLIKFGGKVGWNRKTQETHGSEYGLASGAEPTSDQMLSTYAGENFYEGTTRSTPAASTPRT